MGRVIDFIAKRPLFGILAENYEELRSLRRTVVAGIITALILATYGGHIIEQYQAKTST